MSTATEPVSLRVKLSLPEKVLMQYEEKARTKGLTLERLLAERLADTLHQDAQRPIYLNDADRKALETQLGHNLGTAASLIDAVGKLARIKTGPAVINLTEALLARLRSRCPRNEKFEAYLERVMIWLLEQHVGLR